MHRTAEGAQPLRDAGLYLLLAYGLSWATLIPMVKAGLGEAWLNIGVAGPAIAAMALSRSRTPESLGINLKRWLCFGVLSILCWIVLSCHDQAGSLAMHLNGWLLIPSLVPGWILSSIFSANSGIRSLIRRLVHRPTFRSISPLICWPAFVLIPVVIVRPFHLPLTKPGFTGSGLTVTAQALVLFAYNVLFVGIEEEPGWRGFLLDKLQLRFSPLAASLMVWLPWSLWHAPLDYYRPVRFSLMFWILLRLVMPIPINILLTWFYNRSRRSIQCTAFFHAGMNTFPLVLPSYQPAFVLLFVAAGWVVVKDRLWRTPALGAVCAKVQA